MVARGLPGGTWRTVCAAVTSPGLTAAPRARPWTFVDPGPERPAGSAGASDPRRAGAHAVPARARPGDSEREEDP